MVTVTLESGGKNDPLPAGKVNWMGKTDDGSYCSIKVNNGEKALLSIGINIVVLKFAEQNPPEQSSCFDTCRDPQACNGLVDFLQKIQPGRIVLIAACGSATDCLTEPMCKLLRELGSGYFGQTMDELSGRHRNEAWVMAAKKGTGLIMERSGPGPISETFNID